MQNKDKIRKALWKLHVLSWVFPDSFLFKEMKHSRIAGASWLLPPPLPPEAALLPNMVLFIRVPVFILLWHGCMSISNMKYCYPFLNFLWGNCKPPIATFPSSFNIMFLVLIHFHNILMRGRHSFFPHSPIGGHSNILLLKMLLQWVSLIVSPCSHGWISLGRPWKC